MAGTDYETARIADLERADGWSPIRRHLDVQAFGINAWTAHEPGAVIIPQHDGQPSGYEELYSARQPTNRAGHRRLRADPRRDWARR
jgi:hypothetical protein